MITMVETMFSAAVNRAPAGPYKECKNLTS